MKRSTSNMICAGSLALVLAASTLDLAAETLGTSRADLPNYSAAFSIENTTRVTIPYQYRWGDKHPWKSLSLSSGRVETHTYPLGENPNGRAPVPYVRFDRIGGDNNYTAQEYRMAFHAVGYAGYGPNQNRAAPKQYVFKYAPDGKHLDIKVK
ncbi:MAG: hypothetical protein ABI831_09715 [Betaproteobacteria bacterium]